MQMPSSTGKSYSCFPVEQLKKGSTSILKDKIQISYAFLICSKIINIKKIHNYKKRCSTLLEFREMQTKP